MCLGSIEVLENAWNEGTARVGQLEGGALVSLSFVPDAEAGTYVLVHMGIPVEVLDAETARKALALRKGELS